MRFSVNVSKLTRLSETIPLQVLYLADWGYNNADERKAGTASIAVSYLFESVITSKKKNATALLFSLHRQENRTEKSTS